MIALTAVLGACSGSARTNPPAPAPATAADAPTPSPSDPYHRPPRDTLDAAAYDGWKQYSHHCARCHGEEAQGTSFGPNLLTALRPDGSLPTRESVLAVLAQGRPDRGMPSAATLGLEPTHFDGLYQYLKGRSDGIYHGGRHALRER